MKKKITTNRQARAAVSSSRVVRPSVLDNLEGAAHQNNAEIWCRHIVLWAGKKYYQPEAATVPYVDADNLHWQYCPVCGARRPNGGTARN